LKEAKGEASLLKDKLKEFEISNERLKNNNIELTKNYATLNAQLIDYRFNEEASIDVIIICIKIIRE